MRCCKINRFQGLDNGPEQPFQHFILYQFINISNYKKQLLFYSLFDLIFTFQFDLTFLDFIKKNAFFASFTIFSFSFIPLHLRTHYAPFHHDMDLRSSCLIISFQLERASSSHGLPHDEIISISLFPHSLTLKELKFDHE